MSFYNYVDAVNPNLLCCICRMPFVDPWSTRTCAHTFCRACISRSLETSSLCPVDRSHLGADDLVPASPVVRNLVDELLVECSEAPSGCGYSCQRQLLATHVAECPYTGVHCPHPECAELVQRRELADDVHLRLHTFARCDACRELVTKDGIESHQASCQLEIVQCEHCSDDLERSQLRDHLEFCPSVPVSCAQGANGCPWNGTRHGLQTHLLTCPYEAIKGFFAVQCARSDADATEMGRLREENKVLSQKLGAMEGAMEIMRKEVSNLKASLGPWYRPDTARPPASHAPPPPDLTRYTPGEPVSPDDLTAYFPPQPIAQSTSTHSELASPTGPGTPSVYSPPPFSQTPFHSPHPFSFSAATAAAVQASPVAPLNLSASLEGSFSGLHDSLVALASSVDSLGRRNDIALMTETLRLNEEVGSIRGVLHGLRMQVHSMMMDRNALVASRYGDPSGSTPGLSFGETGHQRPGLGPLHPPMSIPKL